MKTKLGVLWIFFILGFTQANAQEFHCSFYENEELENQVEDDYGESAICSSNNLTNNPDRYKLQSNFKPSPSQPIKYIDVRFHVIQQSSSNPSNFINTTADRVFLQLLVDKANEILDSLAYPYVPRTCACGSNCYIKDTRFRLVLNNRIHFFVDQTAYLHWCNVSNVNIASTSEKNVLDIVFVGDDTGKVGGRVNGLSSYGNLHIQHCMSLKNYNREYINSSSSIHTWTAKALANNFIHEHRSHFWAKTYLPFRSR